MYFVIESLIGFTACAADKAKHPFLSTSEDVFVRSFYVPLGNAAVSTAAGHLDRGAHSAMDGRLVNGTILLFAKKRSILLDFLVFPH